MKYSTMIKGREFQVKKTGNRFFYFSPATLRWLPVSKDRVFVLSASSGMVQ